MEVLFLTGAAELYDGEDFWFVFAVHDASDSRGLRCSMQAVFNRQFPIPVCKASPDAMRALTPSAQGPTLFKRIKDHWSRNITKVQSLNPADFDCRYLVVKSAWVETAEDFLIEWFQPVWNDEVKICYGFGKHGDAPETRNNERSPWDTLHPGRPWATSEANKPNKNSVAQIRADIAEHFTRHHPKT